MQRLGGKIVVPSFALTYGAFLVVCCVSAPFIYVGLPEGIILGFYAGVQFQWSLSSYVIDASIATKYYINSDVVLNNDLQDKQWEIYAYNDKQAIEFFWEKMEKRGVDVIGEPSITARD
jgi:hypothetical protein